jgi:hypothetical protein
MCCCSIILLHLPCYFSTQSDPTRFIQFTGMVGRTISRTVVTSHHFPSDDCQEKILMNGVHSVQQWHRGATQ